MADTEKITINLSVVDLGRIDLLVSEGFYASRTDVIRTAIRNLLAGHDDSIKQNVQKKTMVLGVLSYNRSDLEEKRAAGETVDIRVVGMLVLDDDISPELARATISGLTVHGTFRASPAVKDALADRAR
jgi:Arc/MetJ-type ribon-helix-helix transcriptional regulator